MWGHVNVACIMSSVVSVCVSLTHVLYSVELSDPICGSWFPKSVFPIFNCVIVSAMSLPMYLDWRFLRDCFMCLVVIVFPFILDLCW